MKNVYRVSFMDADTQKFIHVLCETPDEAMSQAGNPTTGPQVQVVASNVEVFGQDKPHIAPKTPATIVIGPPQNIPLQQSEIDKLRAQIGGSGPLTQAEADALRGKLR